MAGVDWVDTPAPRLPSNKSIDERWDRSRSVILRNTERNILRDFRWTVDNPVTFLETPGSTRDYAVRRPIGGKPQANSRGNESAQSNLMDNTQAISNIDLTFNLRMEVKQKDVEIRQLKELRDLMLKKRDQEFQDQRASLHAREMRVKEYEDRVEKDERRVEEQERDISGREKVLKSGIAVERAKALRDAQDAVKDRELALENKREVLRQKQEREDAAQKQKRRELKWREENVERVDANARDNARTAEEAAYDARHKSLDREREVINKDREDSEKSKARFATILAEATEADRETLRQKMLQLERQKAVFEDEKARFDSRIADAREAAKKDVEAQYDGLIEEALQKESDALTKLKEAADLRENAMKIEQEAVRHAQSMWQSHQDAASSSEEAYVQTFARHKDILQRERELELARFRKRLPNAEYRAHIEHQTYESYQEIWNKLLQSAIAFKRNMHAVYVSQQEQVAHWGVLAERFDGARIHPSFPSRYRALCEEIKEHLYASQERSKLAAGRSQQDITSLTRGALRSVLLQGHYSRMLTRFHRFGANDGKASMSEVMNIVFSNGPLDELLENLELRRDKIKIKIELRDDVSNGDQDQLRTELVELDSDIARIKDEKRASGLWRRMESLKILRHEPIHEKEIAVTTKDSSYWINTATRELNEFQLHHRSPIVDSNVSQDDQMRERSETSQDIRRVRIDLQEYYTFIREKCVLKQLLGDVEAHNARLDAIIDEEIEELRPGVLKRARILAGLPSPTASRTRPPEFQTISRSVAPANARAVYRSHFSTPETHMAPQQARTNLGAIQRRVGRVTRRLGLNTTQSKPVSPVQAHTVSHAPSSTTQIPRDGEQEESIARKVDRRMKSLVIRLRQDANSSNAQERAEDEAELNRLKLRNANVELRNLNIARSALLENPNASRAKSDGLSENIRGLERKLAGVPLGITRPSRLSRQRAQPRAKLAAASTNASSKSEPEAPKSAVSNEQETTAAPALNFTATASQKAWHQVWLDRQCSHNTNDINTKAASLGNNALMMSRILSKPSKPEFFAPRALHVYSLHSLHTPATDGEIRSDAEDNFRIPSDFASPDVDTLNTSFELTQSSAEIISDAESDESYEPSESGDSICILEATDSKAETPDLALPLSTPSTQEFADAVETQALAPIIPPALVEEQTDSQMTYHISVEDYKRAAMASKSTNTAFWSYKLYKNAEGKTPSIHYCTNFEAAEAQAKQFVNEAVLGFDLEWEMGASPGKSSIKKCVSLVQIASESKIGLFQLAMFKGDEPEQLMPPSLRKILESRDIVKAGVNISGDANRIEKCFGIKMQGIFELSHLYNVVTWSETAPSRVNKKLFKLADQVQNVLLLPLKKDAVRVSAWSKRLNPEQIEYAASDAYAGHRIYHVLEVTRKKMNPTPPRPAFWEDKKPLVLGDGTVVVSRTGAKKKPAQDGKAVEVDDDDESDEFFDAEETLDPYQFDSTAGVPLAGLSISYPALPAFDEQVDEPLQEPPPQHTVVEPSISAATSSSSTKPPPKPRTTAPSSPAVTQADVWSQTFRNALPATHSLKSRHANLRAYHLWHHQSLECKDIAALLRDPPLSVVTVASYVLQAVSEESELECDRDRVVATLEILPAVARGRYYRVVERVERAEVAREVERGFG